jgi:hypothetical protein
VRRERWLGVGDVEDFARGGYRGRALVRAKADTDYPRTAERHDDPCARCDRDVGVVREVSEEWEREGYVDQHVGTIIGCVR